MKSVNNKVNNKDLEHISQLVSTPDFKQINNSWVLRARFKYKTKAFLHLLK